jgi:type I restriction enzyme S subunit
VTAKNVQDGYLTFNNSHCADIKEYSDLNPKDLPRKGDILITKDGTIGRAALVETNDEFCINQSVAVLWLRSCGLYRPYLLLVIRAPFTQEPVIEAAEGMAIKHLSVSDFAEMLVPLPPLEEQKRIVDKVNSLMALIDALEAQLEASRTTGEKLLEAMVAELTAA